MHKQSSIQPYSQNKTMDKLTTTVEEQNITLSHEFVRQWHQEISRQAKWSFNAAIGLAMGKAALGICAIVLFCSGHIVEGAVSASISIFSVAIESTFELYKKSNQRLDEVGKMSQKNS